MKRGKMLVLLLAAACLVAAPTEAQSKAQPSWERMKSLVGDWSGTAAEGKTIGISYKLVSNGSALVETLKVGTEESMVTIYHLDGDRLLVTHYCGSGNQPRLVGKPDASDPRRIAFNFLDATNLPSADTGHMHSLVVNLIDSDHFTQQWTWREKGKEDKWEVFQFTRKKS